MNYSSKLIEKIPEYYQKIYEFNVLFEILDEELLRLANAYDKYEKDLFIATASDDILLKYANLLQIGDTDFELLRAKIIEKFSEIPPFSYETIKKVVQWHTKSTPNVSKCEGYVINIDYKQGNYMQDFTNIYKDIYNIIPANIAINISYIFMSYIDYITTIYQKLSSKTWQQMTIG